MLQKQSVLPSSLLELSDCIHLVQRTGRSRKSLCFLSPYSMFAHLGVVSEKINIVSVIAM